MEKSVFTEKCLHLLDLEARIRKLRSCEPGKELTVKDVTGTWHTLLMGVVCPLLGAFLLLKFVIPFVNGLGLQGGGKFFAAHIVVIALFIIVFILCGMALLMIILSLNDIKKFVKEAKALITLKKRNAQVRQQNEQNIVDLHRLEQEHDALTDELMRASADLPHDTDSEGHILVNHFFELPFHPEHTASYLWLRNKSGVTFKKEAGNWFCDCCGEFKFTEKGKVPYLNGISDSIVCSPEKLRELVNMPALYLDSDLLEEALQNRPVMRIIREFRYERLINSYTTTTVTSYNLDGALKEYNSAWNDYENTLSPSDNYAAALYERESGEKKLRESLAPTTSTSRKDYVTGEKLEVLDKAYIILYKGKLACVCLPREATRKTTLSYKLDKDILMDEYFHDTPVIPKEVRYHGKLTGLQIDQCKPDHYSTIEYVAKCLSGSMLPLDVLEPQPDGISGTEWRLWTALRYQYRGKNYTR